MARRRRKAKTLTRAVERKLVNVNPGDRDKPSFVLWFSTGGHGTPTYVRVWADHLEDALDEAVDWIVDHRPGLLADEEVEAEYTRLVAEGKSEDDARDGAEVDTTIAGNEGHYLHSENWGVVKEHPSRADILELEGREPEHRALGADRLALKRARPKRLR